MVMDEEQHNAVVSPNTAHHTRRFVVGIVAVLVLAGGVIVWTVWGEEIKETCFGTDGACPVEGVVPVNVGDSKYVGKGALTGGTVPIDESQAPAPEPRSETEGVSDTPPRESVQ